MAKTKLYFINSDLKMFQNLQALSMASVDSSPTPLVSEKQTNKQA